MKILLSLFFAFVCLQTQATTYYVSSSEGNDKNKGTSLNHAWKTISKVNSTIFNPGDSILFASNNVWREALTPKGSGTEGAPIVLSSYGAGNRPLIIGSGFVGAGVISLFNQSYWEISNFELTNNAPTIGDRRGIEIKAANWGLISHIHLKNNLIHHIKGIPGNDSESKRTAGIFIAVIEDDKKPTRFDNILIGDCTIHSIQNQGIALNNERFEKTGYPGKETWDNSMFTNVAIRNNVIYNISKNAMIIRMTEEGIVEHNLCFETATMTTGNTIFSRNAKATLFQYNEGFLNKSHGYDGSLYDPDICSPETIWQYSYSHDNAHGLLWICTRKEDNDIVVRDNISENDRGFLVYYNYAFKNVDVLRNIFLVGEHTSPYLIRENPKNKHEYFSFKNNFICNQSRELSFEYPEESLKESNRDIGNNLFLGNPLKGEYSNSYMEANNFKKFHRGIHHPQDVLDSIFKNPTVGTPDHDVEVDNEIVAMVNNTPVYKYEYEHEYNKLRYLFLAGNKRHSTKEMKSSVMSEIICKKVQQEYMNKEGLDNIQKINTLYTLENAFRKKLEKETVLFFGPRQYTFPNYIEYITAISAENLKKHMSNKELFSTEDETKAHFLIGDKNRVNPTWEKTGYEYAKPAVKKSLLDEKYTSFFKKKAEEAKVVNF